MQPVAVLIGIDFMTGEIVKLFFKKDEKVNDPIYACEQSKLKCEIELPQYHYIIVPNYDAKQLHEKLIKK